MIISWREREKMEKLYDRAAIVRDEGIWIDL